MPHTVQLGVARLPPAAAGHVGAAAQQEHGRCRAHLACMLHGYLAPHAYLTADASSQVLCALCAPPGAAAHRGDRPTGAPAGQEGGAKPVWGPVRSSGSMAQRARVPALLPLLLAALVVVAAAAADSAALLGRAPSPGSVLVSSGQELLQALQAGVGDIGLTGVCGVCEVPGRASLGPCARRRRGGGGARRRMHVPLTLASERPVQTTSTSRRPTGSSLGRCPSGCQTMRRSWSALRPPASAACWTGASALGCCKWAPAACWAWSRWPRRVWATSCKAGRICFTISTARRRGPRSRPWTAPRCGPPGGLHVRVRLHAVPALHMGP